MVELFLVCWLPTTSYKQLRRRWYVSEGRVKIEYAQPSRHKSHIGQQIATLPGDVVRVFDDFQTFRVEGAHT